MGVLFLIVIWFVPFSKDRIVLIVTILSAGMLMEVSGVLGGGAQTRYEYMVLPLLMMVTTGGVIGVLRLIFSLWKSNR